MEGTNKAHEDGEAMGFVGVRLTAPLGRGRFGRANVLRYPRAALNWMFKGMCQPECLLCARSDVTTVTAGR